jgi:hypothetical protein
VRRALTRSENSMSAMVRSRPTRRGGRRRWRRRNATKGARCEETLPAEGADCDRHADSDGDCPANSGARRDSHATAAATATRWPRSCGAPAHAAPDRDERQPGRTRRGRRRPAAAGRTACRRARAASRPPRTSAAAHMPSPAARRAGCAANQHLRANITTMIDSCESVATARKSVISNLMAGTAAGQSEHGQRPAGYSRPPTRW